LPHAGDCDRCGRWLAVDSGRDRNFSIANGMHHARLVHCGNCRITGRKLRLFRFVTGETVILNAFD
jgi:hypothetical protein